MRRRHIPGNPPRGPDRDAHAVVLVEEEVVSSGYTVQGFRPRVEQRYNGGTTCRGATRAVLRSGGRSSGTLADRLFRMFRSGGIPGGAGQEGGSWGTNVAGF